MQMDCTPIFSISLGHFNVGVQRVNGANREADRAARMRPCLKRFIHSNFDVAQIVERIEDADDVNAVFHTLAHEFTHDVIRIMLIAQQVLAPEKHLQLGVWAGFTDGAQPFPRILAQIAKAGVECGAAPALKGIVAGFVEFAKNC